MERVGIMPIRSIAFWRIIIIEANRAYTAEDNTVAVELATGRTERGKLNLSFDTVEASATILANKLLD